MTDRARLAVDLARALATSTDGLAGSVTCGTRNLLEMASAVTYTALLISHMVNVSLTSRIREPYSDLLSVLVQTRYRKPSDTAVFLSTLARLQLNNLG
jgi:hypothetical protein